MAYKKAYDDRRSKAEVFVNSTFILQCFKQNLSKGFYGDKELQRLCKKIILELWRRDPALLEYFAELVASKYGKHLQDTYGKRDFRKKLIEETNRKRAEKIERETKRKLLEMQSEEYSVDGDYLHDYKGDD